MTRISRLAAGLLAVGCLLLAPRLALAQRARAEFEVGSQAFRQLLGWYHAEPLETVADLSQVDPQDTLLIVFGSTQILDQVPGGVAAFRAAGGAVLIASDRDDFKRVEGLGIHIPGQRLQQDENRAYRGQVECPFIRIQAGAQHPLFWEMKTGIATNQPSYLSPLGEGDLEILAQITLVTNPRLRFGPNVSWPYLAAGAGGDGKGPGRVVVLAGHGVFMNMMLLQRDNDNARFAINCISWLTEEGRRRHVFFVEEGQILTSFPPHLAKLPPIPLKVPEARILDEMLHGLEEENAFNNLLLQGTSGAVFVRGAVLGLTLLLLFWGLRRLLLARHQVEPRLPLLERRVALALAVPAVYAQRRQALLRGGNLWETARDLARECFEGHAPSGAAAAPAFVVQGGWWQRRRLTGLVRRLATLAYDPGATAVSARELARVRAEAEQLRAALDAGRVTFPAEDKAGHP